MVSPPFVTFCRSKTDNMSDGHAPCPPDSARCTDEITAALRDGGLITRQAFVDRIRAANDLTPETMAARYHRSRGLDEVSCKMVQNAAQASVLDKVTSSQTHHDWRELVNPDAADYSMTPGQMGVLLFLLSSPLVRKGDRMASVVYSSRVGIAKTVQGERIETLHARACDGPSLAILPSMPGSGKSPVAMSYLIHMALSDRVWRKGKTGNPRLGMGMIGASDVVTQTIRVGRVNMSSVEMMVQMLSEFVNQFRVVDPSLKDEKKIEVWIDTVAGTGGPLFAAAVDSLTGSMCLTVLYHGSAQRNTNRFMSEPNLVVFWFGITTSPVSMNMSKRANDKKRKLDFESIVDSVTNNESVTNVIPLVTVTDEAMYRHHGMAHRDTPFLHCLLLSGVPALVASSANSKRGSAKGMNPVNELFSPGFRAMCDAKQKMTSEMVKDALASALKVALLTVPGPLVRDMEDDAADMMPCGFDVKIVKAACTRMAPTVLPVRPGASTLPVSVVGMLVSLVPFSCDPSVRVHVATSAQHLVDSSNGVISVSDMRKWIHETNELVPAMDMDDSLGGGHACGCGGEDVDDDLYAMGCCTGVVCGACVRTHGERCYHCASIVLVEHDRAAVRMSGNLNPSGISDLVDDPIDIFPTIQMIVKFAMRRAGPVRLLVYGGSPPDIVSMLESDDVDVSEMVEKGLTVGIERYRDMSVMKTQVLVANLSNASTAVTGLNFPDTDGIIVIGDSPLLPQIMGRVMRPGGSDPDRVVDIFIVRATHVKVNK